MSVTLSGLVAGAAQSAGATFVAQWVRNAPPAASLFAGGARVLLATTSAAAFARAVVAGPLNTLVVQPQTQLAGATTRYQIVAGEPRFDLQTGFALRLTFPAAYAAWLGAAPSVAADIRWNQVAGARFTPACAVNAAQLTVTCTVAFLPATQNPWGRASTLFFHLDGVQNPTDTGATGGFAVGVAVLDARGGVLAAGSATVPKVFALAANTVFNSASLVRTTVLGSATPAPNSYGLTEGVATWEYNLEFAIAANNAPVKKPRRTERASERGKERGVRVRVRCVGAHGAGRSVRRVRACKLRGR